MIEILCGCCALSTGQHSANGRLECCKHVNAPPAQDTFCTKRTGFTRQHVMAGTPFIAAFLLYSLVVCLPVGIVTLLGCMMTSDACGLVHCTGAP